MTHEQRYVHYRDNDNSCGYQIEMYCEDWSRFHQGNMQFVDQLLGNEYRPRLCLLQKTVQQ